MDLSDGGGGGGGAGFDRHVQAQRWIEIAERLLSARDLHGCLRFAERALDLDPLTDPNADRLIAISQTLLHSHSQNQSRFQSHSHLLNWYAILDLPFDSNPSPAEISRSFRRLSLVLQTGGNQNPFISPLAEAAGQLISQAYSVLSDPKQKLLFDAQLRGTQNNTAARAAAAVAVAGRGTSDAEVAVQDGGNSGGDDSTFWTSCPACCNVHQYADRVNIGRRMRCPSCQNVFVATELSSPPPIVPGTCMYFCSWGFFPMGFGDSQSSAPDFAPSFGSRNSEMPAAGRGSDHEIGGAPTAAAPPCPAANVVQQKSGRSTKMVAASKTANTMKRKDGGGDAGENANVVSGNRLKPVVIDINEEWDVNQEAVVGAGMQGEDVDISSFDIEIDVDNMPSFSFL